MYWARANLGRRFFYLEIIMNDNELLIACNDHLSYNPLTGIITWKKRGKNSGVKIGDEAGTLKLGYLSIGLLGRQYRSNRLAFLMYWGYLPKFIDHKDRDKLNNRIDNLRKCTNIKNQQNVGVNKSNTSGYKGVSWNKETNKWLVIIRINKKQTYLGRFTCRHEAARVWNTAARMYQGYEFCYTNKIPITK